jgi:hypothetical protein
MAQLNAVIQPTVATVIALK